MCVVEKIIQRLLQPGREISNAWVQQHGAAEHAWKGCWRMPGSSKQSPVFAKYAWRHPHNLETNEADMLSFGRDLQFSTAICCEL